MIFFCVCSITTTQIPMEAVHLMTLQNYLSIPPSLSIRILRMNACINVRVFMDVLRFEFHSVYGQVEFYLF